MSAPTSTLKVLVVIDSLGLGGAENLLAVLGRAAPAAGLQMHVASLMPASMGRVALQPVMEEAGVTVSFLDVHRLRSPGALRSIMREIRLREADVVHAHLGYSSILAPIAARLTGRPSVSTLHHVPEDLPARERVKEWMAVEISGRLGRLLFVSDASRREFAGRYHERPSWSTVRNGVELHRFDPTPAPPPRDLPIPPGVPVVTIVAALRVPKGHEVALRAWPEVLAGCPEARLLLVGEGPARESLQRLVAQLDLTHRVVFTGLRSDVPDLIRASTVVLLPSVTEALPTVLIEAAACARPVVATTVGGTPEVVEDGRTGVLIPPGDAERLADAVAQLLGDPSLREQMGREGRALAQERFDAAVWARRLRALYEEGRRPPAHGVLGAATSGRSAKG